MIDTTRITVAVDFSDGSITALGQAQRLAEWGGAELSVIHVVEAAMPTNLSLEVAEAIDLGQTRREQSARKHLAELPPSPSAMDTVVVAGSALHEVLHHVKTTNADLLIMGTRGHVHPTSGVGTLAMKCVRKCPTNVLLVDTDQRGPFERIVVGVDFSKTSVAAMAQAIRIAIQDQSRIDLVHIYVAPWHVMHYRAPSGEFTPELRRQYVSDLEAQLKSLVAEFAQDTRGVGLDIRCRAVEATSYGRGLVDYARTIDADLVILGNLGHTTLRYLLMGSTAERVLKETTCSALIVRAESSPSVF